MGDWQQTTGFASFKVLGILSGLLYLSSSYFSFGKCGMRELGVVLAVIALLIAGLAGYLKVPEGPGGRIFAVLISLGLAFEVCRIGISYWHDERKSESATTAAKQTQKFQDRTDEHNQSHDRKLDEIKEIAGDNDGTWRKRFPYGYYRCGNKRTEGYVGPPEGKPRIEFVIDNFSFHIHRNFFNLGARLSEFKAVDMQVPYIEYPMTDGKFSFGVSVVTRKGSESPVLKSDEKLTMYVMVLNPNRVNPELVFGYRFEDSGE